MTVSQQDRDDQLPKTCVKKVYLETHRFLMILDKLSLVLRQITRPPDARVFVGIKGLIAWKARDHHWFDKDQLEMERPEIYAEYWKTRIQRNLYLSR